MGAHRQKPLGHGQIAVAQRAVHQRIHSQRGAQFAPQCDAFQQSARPVHPRQAKRQGGVHVKMRVDEGGRDKATFSVDLFTRLSGDMWGHFGDFVALNGDVLALAPIGQVGLPQDQIEHGASLGFAACAGLWAWCRNSAATPRAIAWGCLPKAGWPMGQVILAISIGL